MTTFPSPLGVSCCLLALTTSPLTSSWCRRSLKDCITGIALTGPLAGEYGEPDIALVLQVLAGPT